MASHALLQLYLLYVKTNNRAIGANEADNYHEEGANQSESQMDWNFKAGCINQLLNRTVGIQGLPPMILAPVGTKKVGKTQFLSILSPWEDLLRPGHETRSITIYIPFKTRQISFYVIVNRNIEEITKDVPKIDQKFYSGSRSDAIGALHKLLDSMTDLKYASWIICVHFPISHSNRVSHHEHKISFSSDSSFLTHSTSPDDSSSIADFPSRLSSPPTCDITMTVSCSEIPSSSSSNSVDASSSCSSLPATSSSTPISSEMPIQFLASDKPVQQPEHELEGVVFIDVPGFLQGDDVAVKNLEKSQNDVEKLKTARALSPWEKISQKTLQEFCSTFKSSVTFLFLYKSIGLTERTIFTKYFEIEDPLGVGDVPSFTFFLRILHSMEKTINSFPTEDIRRAAYFTDWLRGFGADPDNYPFTDKTVPHWDCIASNLSPFDDFSRKFAKFAEEHVKREGEDQLHIKTGSQQPAKHRANSSHPSSHSASNHPICGGDILQIGKQDENIDAQPL